MESAASTWVPLKPPNIDRGLSLALLFDLANELEVEPYQLLKFGLEDGN